MFAYAKPQTSPRQFFIAITACLSEFLEELPLLFFCETLAVIGDLDADCILIGRDRNDYRVTPACEFRSIGNQVAQYL